MANLKVKKKNTLDGIAWYRGKKAKTGNSLGLRFDKALFQSHPEFSGEVRAHVIAPGRMLVIAEPAGGTKRAEDPVIGTFLSFLARDMARAPGQIKALDRSLTKRIDALVGHVPVNPHEDLGDDILL
jgi:hypothetical protein